MLHKLYNKYDVSTSVGIDVDIPTIRTVLFSDHRGFLLYEGELGKANYDDRSYFINDVAWLTITVSSGEETDINNIMTKEEYNFKLGEFCGTWTSFYKKRAT